MFRRRDDGSYAFSQRFWITAVITGAMFCLIGFNTQRVSDRNDALSTETRAFAAQTNQCLSDVVNVLTTRVGYNDAVDANNQKLRDLDARRQTNWDTLVDDLSKSDNENGLNQAALAKFKAANELLKADQAKARADGDQLMAARAKNQYPDCPAQLAKSAPPK